MNRVGIFMSAIAAIGAVPATLLPLAYEREAQRAEDRAWEARDMLAVHVVGYGCVGASGPLLATEEDNLPRCARIEALPDMVVVDLVGE